MSFYWFNCTVYLTYRTEKMHAIFTQLNLQMLAITYITRKHNIIIPNENIAHAPFFFLEAKWYILGSRGDPLSVISILYKPKQFWRGVLLFGYENFYGCMMGAFFAEGFLHGVIFLDENIYEHLQRKLFSWNSKALLGIINTFPLLSMKTFTCGAIHYLYRVIAAPTKNVAAARHDGFIYLMVEPLSFRVQIGYCCSNLYSCIWIRIQIKSTMQKTVCRNSS